MSEQFKVGDRVVKANSINPNYIEDGRLGVVVAQRTRISVKTTPRVHVRWDGEVKTETYKVEKGFVKLYEAPAEEDFWLNDFIVGD